MSEEIKNNKQSITDIANALRQDFATTVNRIYINSIKKEIGFKEITVTQQKTLSRIMIENNKRKDIIFDAQCALINEVCLEPDSFDIYDCLEFDRLKLLIALYQANIFKNDINFTCESCGAENKFTLDFDIVLKKLDNIELKEKEFNYENKIWKYNFIIKYPTVRRVRNFYASNIYKYKGAKKQQVQSLDNIQNIDYINLFINNVSITNKTANTVKNINFDDFDAGDIEQLISVFPQDVLYSDNGILKFIVNEYIKKINDTFEQHECYQCGEKYENDITSTEGFL